MMMTDQVPCQMKGDTNMESSEDSNDEIQRYMHGRGCSKRHTVGCTDDLSMSQAGQCIDPPIAHSPIPSTSGMSQGGSSGRTRRTGLLTVMERPPGRFMSTSSRFSLFFFACMNLYLLLLYYLLLFAFFVVNDFNFIFEKPNLKVISPDLIREVEARMNRNYLPPSLKHQVSGSPPSNSYVMPQQRRFGRACKLPTVQEVMGKLRTLTNRLNCKRDKILFNNAINSRVIITLA